TGCSLSLPAFFPSAPPKVPRIGYLTVAAGENEDPWFQAVKHGLQDLGYREGQTIAFEYRGQQSIPALPALANELVQRQVDVIVVLKDPSLAAAKQAAGDTIPIVMAGVSDPLGSGFVASLARPGGSVTGLSIVSPELSGKRL